MGRIEKPKQNKTKCISFPVIVSSTTAAGKNSFFELLKGDLKSAVIVPRLTTRNRRRSEINTSDYLFVKSKYIYSQYYNNNLLFLEENYGGLLYGVLKNDVERILEEGMIPVIVTNSEEGISKILKTYPTALYIFISPIDEELSLKLISSKSSEKAEAKLKTRLERLIHKRNRPDFDIDVRIARSICWAKRLFYYDSIIYNKNDRNQTSGKVFLSNYHKFRDLILDEIKYRSFLYELAKKWRYQWKNGSQSQKSELIRYLKLLNLDRNLFILPSKDCIRTIVVALRSLRKEDLKEKEPALNLFYFPNPSERISKTTEWLSYHFSPNLPIIKALTNFLYFEETSRIIITRDNSEIFRFDPRSQVLTISENLFSPSNSLNKVKELINIENNRNNKVVAELPCLRRLQVVAQGGFEEKSERFEKMAKEFLEKCNKSNFISTMIEYSYSGDWYHRRLVAESLSFLKPFHPDREKIIAVLLKLIKDPKIGQVSDPALVALKKIALANYKTNTIQKNVIDILHDPNRAWARSKMLDVLGTIGSKESLNEIFEELGNSERYYNRLSCLENLKKFKPDQNITHALSYISNFDQVMDVKQKAKEITQKHRISLKNGHDRKILDPSWISRTKAFNELFRSKKVETELVLSAFANTNWRIKYTSIPLLQFCPKELSNRIIPNIFTDPHTSLHKLLKETLINMKGDIISDVIPWLNIQNPWVQLNTIQILGELVNNSPERRSEIISLIYNLLIKSNNLLTKSVAAYELGRLIDNSDKSYRKIRSYLKSILVNPKSQILQWSVIEGLDLSEPQNLSEDPLNVSYSIREKFGKTINNFNKFLRKNNYGKIEKIILEDSSYSKKDPIFCVGSDFDTFRILYSRNIPQQHQEELRNKIWSLGIYIKPEEPEWWKINDEEKMFKTAVDVITYKNNQACNIRPVINDFVEKKSELRRKIFSGIENKLFTNDESKLIRKLHRLYTIQRLFGSKVKLTLKNRRMKHTLKKLIDQDYITRSNLNRNFYKINWMTFTGKYILIHD